MTDPQELVRLRAEARRKTKNMTNKISRVKGKADKEYNRVYLSGTGWDLRKPRKVIDRMNAASLNKYIREANVFLSPKTQFISEGGVPLLKSTYEEYERNQRKYNEQALSVHEYGQQFELADHSSDYLNGLTADRLAHPNKEKWARQHPGKMKEVFRGASYFFSQSALNVANERMKKRAKEGYADKVSKDIRKNMRAMGIDTRKLRGISTGALVYAWQYGKLAHRAADFYEELKKQWKRDSRDITAVQRQKDKERLDIARHRFEEQFDFMREIDRYHTEKEKEESAARDKARQVTRSKKKRNKRKK